MRVQYKPSRRYAEYVRKITCDEWEPVGVQSNDRAVLLHKPTGEKVAYNLHDGGNDWNGPRNFALAVQRLCGCRLIEPRGRKRSRKSPRDAVDQELEAARRKHAADFEARADARDAQREQEARRRLAAKVAAEQDRRRREIEDLMR